MKRINCLSIQWHITHRCSNRCRHCYLQDPTIANGNQGTEESLDTLLKSLNSICSFEARRQVTIDGFAVGGGDPLLHPAWYEFLRELRSRGKTVHLMANPETLTERNLALLAELQVSKVQLSLDGLQSVHDDIRSVGSFQRTIEALRALKEHGLRSQIMFTLTAENRSELIPLLRFVAVETVADAFAFDLGCGRSARGLSADTVRSDFEAYREEKARLRQAGAVLDVQEKNALFRVLRFESGEHYPFDSTAYPVITGCLAGWTSVTVDSDSTVLPCRRLPLKAGNLRSESFESIFLSSTAMKRFRRPQFFPKCHRCGYYKYCRGCTAAAEDSSTPNPLCFALPETRTASKISDTTAFPTMESSPEEELTLVASHFANVFAAEMERWLARPEIGRHLFCLAHSATYRRNFFCPVHDGSALNNDELNAEDRVFLQYFLERFPPDCEANRTLYQAVFSMGVNRNGFEVVPNANR